MPARTSASSSSSLSASPSTSPLPPKFKSSKDSSISDYQQDMRSLTPVRSNSDNPGGSNRRRYGSKTEGMRRARSREDINTNTTRHQSEKAQGNFSYETRSKSPLQHSPYSSLSNSSSSYRRRATQDVIGDLKRLSAEDGPQKQRSITPQPKKLKSRFNTGSIENLTLTEEEETTGGWQPHVFITPSTPTSNQDGDNDIESPLDFYPTLSLASSSHLILDALFDKE